MLWDQIDMRAGEHGHCVVCLSRIRNVDESPELCGCQLPVLGFIPYPSYIMLKPGAVLVGGRIEVPGGDSVTIDLEVRYSDVVTLPDGSRPRCSGICFVNAGNDVKKLIDAHDFGENRGV